MRIMVARTLLLCACLAAALGCRPALADRKTDALVTALSLPDVIGVMHDEGLAYGRDLEKQMFPGKGGESWAAAVKGIYGVDRVLPDLEKRLDSALADQHGDIDAMLAFLQSETGRKAVTLEISARRALLDKSVEDAAKVRLGEMRAADDPRLQAIVEFAKVNDLVESNVSSGMNANLAFYRGLAEAGAFTQPLTEDEMLSDVWAQEPSLRSDTEEWLYSFLVLAYAPLTDPELRAYTDFGRSKPGHDLNAALFQAFDGMFADVSGRLGRSAAQHVAGQNL